MKRGLWILAVAVLACIAGFFVMRRQCSCVMPASPVAHAGDSRLPELEWLRQEMHLSESQFAEVSALHAAYRPTCELLCQKVMTSNKKVKNLAADGRQVSPQLQAALDESAALRVECQRAMLTHLYQTAACMGPEQSARYLAAMLPQVIDMPNHSASAPHGH